MNLQRMFTEKVKNYIIILLLAICITEFVTIIIYNLYNKDIEYVTIDDAYGHNITPFEKNNSTKDKRVITMEQLKHIAEHMKFSIIQDVDDLYKVRISESNKLSTVPDLEPIKRTEDNLIIESNLYGYWISATKERALGFQFQPTDEFGPYTIVKVDGLLDDGTTSEVKIGFYQVIDSQTLVLHFKQKLNFDDEDSVIAIDEVEEWSVSKVGEFFVLKNDEQQLNISKFQQQESLTEDEGIESEK